MLSFFQNFTLGLARRFNAPSSDIAPKSFNNELLQFVSDIERKKVDNHAINFNVENVSVPSSQSRDFSAQYAVRPFTGANSQWIYPLGEISKIVLKSVTVNGVIDRGLGGTGNYLSRLSVKINGVNLQTDTSNEIYNAFINIPVGAGSALLSHLIHFQDEITLYHGDDTFVFTDSGLSPGLTGLPLPQFILFVYRFLVPGTAADVNIERACIIWNLETTFSNGTTKIEQRYGFVL